MHVSDGGAALALQPEDQGEKTALTRLRAIFRRATQYRLPGPYWVDAAEFTDLEPTGRDALVVQDGVGWDRPCGGDSIGGRLEEPRLKLQIQTEEGTKTAEEML